MAAERPSVVVLLTAVLLFFAGAVRGGELRPRLVGAPQTIDDPENDEGLQRALQFAMTAYNRASNDMYSSRVVRIISAQKQVSEWGRHSPLGGLGMRPAGFLWREGRPASCRFSLHRVNKSPFLYLGFPWSE